VKSILLFSIVVAAGVAACDKSGSAPADAGVVGADNTKVNERDRGSQTLTPGDQAENDADRGITQQIRQAVVKDDQLSMTAKNIKIITINGVVTLRGPVKTEQEKAEIATLTQRVDGIKRLDNQLELATN
jgi:hyperosmotically inducible protein